MAKLSSPVPWFFLVFLTLWSWVCFSATPLDQKPSGAINDFAGLISPETKNSLEQLSIVLLKKTGVSLVLATTPDLDGGDIDETANRLFAKWGVGSKENNEGILVLVAVKERAIRIETGYGAEGFLTDAQSKRIIRDVAAPYLSKGQWDAGLSAAMLAIAETAARAHGTSLKELIGQDAPAQTYATDVKKVKLNAFSIILIAILILFLLGTRMGRSILFMMIMSSAFSGGRSGNSSSGFGGGFSGGGGFGGGMSGGGGASGRF